MGKMVRQWEGKIVMQQKDKKARWWDGKQKRVIGGDNEMLKVGC